MKRTAIQPRPLPETIFEFHENYLLSTILTVENMETNTNNNNFNFI
jgi:hypothetical protein